MVTFTGVSPFLLLIARRGWTQEARPDFQPTLRLEKPLYALGEQVRFWVGIRAVDHRPIPEEVLGSPCTLWVTKPDGTTETQSIGPPQDRMPGAGYEGGMGISGKIQAGRYALVLECSKQETKPVELTVDRRKERNLRSGARGVRVWTHRDCQNGIIGARGVKRH